MKLPKLFLGPFRPLKRPRWPVDRNLVSKQLRAAAALPPDSIKPVYVEDQSYEQCTTFAPVDFEQLPV